MAKKEETMTAAKATKDLRDAYTFLQRVVYQAKKHWMLVLLAIGSLFLLSRLDPALELLLMSVNLVARFTIGVAAAELVWSFRIPKIGLQTALGQGNTAAAMVYCVFILAAVLA